MSAARLRVHVENRSTLAEMFQVTERLFRDAADRHPEVAAYVEASFGQDGDTFAGSAPDADALLGYVFPRIDLRTPPSRLSWVQLTGAGIDHLGLKDWLPPRAVVTNNSGVHAERGGEFGLLAVLALNARLPAFATQKQKRVWRPIFEPSAAGKTVLVVGVGAFGSAIARRCRENGLVVLGTRQSGAPDPNVDEMLRPEQLRGNIGRADFVVITAPLTSSTRGLFDAAMLAAMKPGAGLANFGRAPLVDHAALRDALDSGHLSGAFLDVFDPEPLPPESTLWDMPNAIFTPHVSCDDPGRYIPDTLNIFFENAGRWLSGRPLRNVVDLERGY